MAHLTILGSSSGVTVAGRGHAALWLQTEHFNLLIDAGDGVSRSLAQANVPLPKLDAVVITHMHPDHCSGLPMLMYNLYQTRRENELKVYLPVHGIAAFQNFFPGVYVFPEKWPFPYSFHEIPRHVQYDDVQLTFRKNRHLEKLRALAEKYQVGTDAYTVEFEAPRSEKIVYSSDYRTVDDLLPVLKGTGTAIIECSHSPVPDVFRVAREAGLKKLIVNHIPPDVETRLEEYRILAGSMGLDQVTFSYDGLEIGF